MDRKEVVRDSQERKNCVTLDKEASMRVYGQRERLRRLIRWCTNVKHGEMAKSLEVLDPETCTNTNIETIVGPYWGTFHLNHCVNCHKDCKVTVLFGDGDCDNCGGEVQVCLACLDDARELLSPSLGQSALTAIYTKAGRLRKSL